MAITVNARDLTIQAQLPRLLPVTLPGNVTVPTTNVPGLPDYYASSKQVELRSTSQIFQISKVGGISPAAIILTAEKKNILGVVTWTVVAGNVTYTTGNDTLTIQAGGLTSDTATIRASVTSDGIVYTDVMTIVRVQEGIDSVTGFLTNESTSVPALANGAVLSYDNTGGQFRVLKGITDVTGTAVAYSVVSATGVNISIANTGVYTVNNLTVDAGSAILQASYGGVVIQKTYTITKSKQGAAGITTYTWIKYADNAQGAGLSDSPVGKLYIGLAYNKTTPVESDNPADYEYALIKGADGQNGTDGTNGIPGAPGADGKTTYTWIKYSDYADGTNPYDTPNDNTQYIGIAVNKLTPAESTDKNEYTWSKFKGDQGVPGQNGVTTYTWIKYADNASGGGLSDDPTGKLYIGFAFNKLTPVESNNPADYAFSLIKGTDGSQGIPGQPGADGITYYTWLKYSDYADGTNPYDVPNANTMYIGIAVNKTTATESDNKADYSWSKFKGDQGVPGTPGSNGQRGTVNISVATTQNIWTDAAANNGIANAGYGVPQSRDIVTLYNTSTNFSQSKFYDSGAWHTLDAYINGNLLVNGTVLAEKIDSRGLSIKDPAGNVILSAGVPLDSAYLNFGAGTGNLISNSGPFPGTVGAYKILYTNVNGKTVNFGASYDPFRPIGAGGVYVEIPAGIVTSEWAIISMVDPSTGGEKKYPVQAGKRYEASMYLSAHRCSGQLNIVFLNSAGAEISRLKGNTVTGPASGPLDSWEPYRSSGFAVAPAGAAYAILRLEAGPTTGEAFAYLFGSMAYFATALTNQTVFTAWADGPGATLGGDVFGQITPSNASTYIADAAIRFAAIDKATIGNLSVVSQLVGLLRTRDTGARMEIADDVIRIYNDSNQIKIRIGKLD